MSYLEQRRAFIEAGRPLKEKKKYVIPAISEKRKVKIQQQKEANTDDGLWKWFEERRTEMKGVCANCGKPTCKNDDEKFHFSIAHLLPKNFFDSVKTNPNNWIELCFWGEKSCHTNFDQKMLDLIDMNCFSTIVDRFVAMYPMIDKNERRRIPNVLMQYIEVEL